MRDWMNIVESMGQEPIVLQPDGSNEEEFLRAVQSVDGKVKVDYDWKEKIFIITMSNGYITDENEDWMAIIPYDYKTFNAGTLADTGEVGHWLYQNHCNVSGF